MLTKYRLRKFFIVYIKSLNPNVVIHINMAIIILKKNNVTEEILRKRKNIEIPPTKLPSTILNSFTCLFNMSDTESNRIKSKNMLIKKSRSTYTFILSPLL